MPPLMVRPPEPLLNTINRPAASVMIVPIASRRIPSHLGMGYTQTKRGGGGRISTRVTKRLWGWVSLVYWFLAFYVRTLLQKPFSRSVGPRRTGTGRGDLSTPKACREVKGLNEDRKSTEQQEVSCLSLRHLKQEKRKKDEKTRATRNNRTGKQCHT